MEKINEKAVDKTSEEEKLQLKDLKANTLFNFRILISKLIFLTITIYVIAICIFGFFRTNGIAMTPIINDGDLIVFYRLNKDYLPGDVVVINKYGQKKVLRIIATEGQTVNFDENKNLYVNNHLDINKVFFENVLKENSDLSYPLTVGKNQYYVLGDYRTETNDSREFGCINKSEIEGKIIIFLRTKNI